MEIMLSHETLLGTVSRTLRDDYKKSMELALYLLNIFQAYSNFSEFHEFLITVSIILNGLILKDFNLILTPFKFYRTKSATPLSRSSTTKSNVMCRESKILKRKQS